MKKTAKPTPEKFTVRIKKFWSSLGPGLITGASDDDPSGIATYSQAGAGFGLATLWTALITFPLMAAVQEMCARIGAVTSTGLTGVLKKHYPKSFLFLMMLFSFPAIIFNIGADIESMGAVMHLLFPAIPIFLFEIVFTAIILFVVIRYSYHQLSGILKWLCIVLFIYIIIPFLVKVDWANVAKHTFVPTIKLDSDFLQIIVAILGTTISPYLFFWQATMEAEDISNQQKTVVVDKLFLRKLKFDTYVGMFLSNLVMFFIILTTGVVLYGAGIHNINTVDQAATALAPLAGNTAYILFAVGIIGTGFLAIPVLAGSLSYIVAETFDMKQGFQKKFTEAPGFYLVISISLIAGLGMDFLGISPMKALIYTAILYGLTAPFMIGIVLHICNNKKVMGDSVNGRGSNALGILTLILMSICGGALVYFQFQ
ncbi:MAG: divalent metal cation transporter [Bacteroidetes bacterium]|nr:divalent metal cation transporter [Bacteroidota bacterium]